MKTLLKTNLLIIFSIMTFSSFSQELSNLAKSLSDKLQNEYYPDLKSRKEKIEANRKSGPPQECNDFIDALNRALAVWNNIPKKEYNHPTIVAVGKPLDEYLAWGKTAQEIFKERKANESSTTSTTSQSNNGVNNTNNSNQQKSFKVGEKISALYNGDWMEGTITSIEGNMYKVDVTAPSMYKGAQNLPIDIMYTYWPYVDFLESMVRTNKSKIFNFLNVMHEICGDCASGFSIVNLNGKEILEAAKEIDYVASELKKYPPIPADNNLKNSYTTNPKTYEMVVAKKKEFFDKKYGDMIKQHLTDMENNSFSPVSISNASKQLTYDDKTTIFWSDLICKSDAPIKKAILADLNEYIYSAGLKLVAESFFSEWDIMVQKIKSDKLKVADEPVNWSQKYPYTDAAKEKLVKSTFGQNISSVKFYTNQPTETATNTNGVKSRETTGIYFNKIEGCSYYQWVKVVCYQEYKGGAWGPMKVVANSSGYTKNL
ncbi:MAG: hypothetical protein SFY56_05455 [Bacteroidota bacterium]|nr:hypothetical protein [Bacteroidota bacterium]